jgi:tetratricopeptide (TPR) repeat protein
MRCCQADAQCISEAKCSSTHDSTETRLSSIMDLHMKSLFHPSTSYSFVQLGRDTNFTRLYPYSFKSYGVPDSCFIDDTAAPQCFHSYHNSKCGDPSLPNYPLYDPVCRSWYQLGALSSALPNLVYFQKPRVSSSGASVISAIIQVRRGASSTGALYGVINLSVKSDQLSNSINSFKILKSGYVFVVDARNASTVILHPKLTATCSSLRCVESQFSDFEFAIFDSTVLQPIQNGGTDFAVSYKKNGQSWRLSISYVNYETIEYAIIATVPLEEIMKPSKDVEDNISRTIVSIIIAASFCCFAFIAVIVYVIFVVAGSTSSTLEHLTKLTAEICEGNLSATIEVTGDGASSLDMVVILNTFSSLLTALRFGSESYARGDSNRAKTVFEDALKLYTATNNQKGIGACHNNLGAVCTSLEMFKEAKSHYEAAIQLAEEAVSRATDNGLSEADIFGAKRTLSDRRGNLAMLLLAMKDYPSAFEILDSAIESDKKMGYIRGCVIKQGNMGHLYNEQGEVKSAEKLFLSSLTFVANADKRLHSATWNEQEAEVSLQIALFNMAKLEMKKNRNRTAEHYLILTLMHTSIMHVPSARQAFQGLLSLYPRDAQKNSRLRNLAERLQFTLETISKPAKKRVAFGLDYSGSMAGDKINSSSANLLSMFQKHIADDDEVMIMHFTSHCTVDIDLCTKKGNVEKIENAIKRLTRPGGSTAFYDAIKELYQRLRSLSTDNDWVIVLTDGEDTASSFKHDNAMAMIQSNSSIGLVIIAAGSDVDSGSLQRLVKCSSKGILLSVTGNQSGIDDAFGKVAKIIQSGQLVLEDV